MKYLFFFLVSSLFFTCNTTEQVVPTGGESFSYLALGDSYTIGESVSEAERYPNQLADSLSKRSVFLDPVDIVARTGWTTDELDAGINDRTNLKATYDLVSLLIGVNNQYRGRPVDEYEEEFRALLQRAIDFAGGDKERVFVISIPDYAYTPFGNGNNTISEGIDAFNAVNESVTGSYGISYFNITPISREGLAQPDLVANDGLHPSGAQYARWVGTFVENIKEKLEN